MRTKIYILLFCLCSCIDQFSLDGDQPQPQPVIEGLVANVEGESFVRISTELSILGLQQDPLPLISGATVEVADNKGNSYNFCEKSSGLYLPEDQNFIGSLLDGYRLQVQLADGRIYRSTEASMPPGVSVDTVLVYFRKDNIPGSEQATGAHEFFITVSAEASGPPVLFRTSSLGIAQVAAYIDPPSPLCGAPPCAEICYSFRGPINREVVLGSTEGTAQNRLTLQVSTEDYDFHSHYFIRVKTFSLTQQGNRFWSSLANQQQIDGSIFDPQLSEIEGTNIFNQETGEEIIGYFGASAISSDSLFFNRFETAGFLAPIPTTSTSCTDVWRAATLDVPEQFQ